MRAILLAGVLLLAGHASAADCTPTTSTAIDTGETPEGRFYVLPECLLIAMWPGSEGCPGKSWFSFWIYEEANGIDGLQRRDEVRDDTCGGLIEGDRIIF